MCFNHYLKTLELTTTSVVEIEIHKILVGSGITILIISKGIMKIVKSLQDSYLLINTVTQTIEKKKNKKNKRVDFLVYC